MTKSMRHLFLFAFVCFLSAILQIHLNDFKSFANSLQSKCAEKLARNSSVARDLNRALACGTDLPPRSPWKQLLTRTGLYHLVVVSGSHLVLLELALRKLPSAIFGVSAGFLLFLTGLQAPLARGLLARFAPLAARGPFRVALVHFLTLLLFPAWTGSLSLALSTAASFGLSARMPKASWRPWQRLTLPWLFTLPLITGFGSAHPSQLLSNALCAGFVTFVLTPFAYFQLVFPSVDLSWCYEIFRRVLLPLASLNTTGIAEGPRLGHGPMSFYLLSLFLATHLWNIRVLRHAS